MSLQDSLEGRLLFAVPKKGRIYTKVLDLLRGADIQFKRSDRLDIALVTNLPLALVFLPSADIPRFVGEGNIALGITGQDLIADSGVKHLCKEVLPLGFGKCQLQLQVPESSAFLSAKDLIGKTIATSFETISGEFFSEMERDLPTETQRTKVEFISGSVETACALGLADAIVDLVESGQTMKAAGLHPIATIMQSQSVLIRPAKKLEDASEDLITKLIARIDGVLAADRYVLCNYNVRRADLSMATAITPGRRAATVSPLDDPAWVAVSSMVERANLARIMDDLQAAGAEDILVLKLDNCRV